MRDRFLVFVKKDLFNIVNRLKKIDKTYYVLFNKKTKNFELHSCKQRGSTLCLIVGKKLNAQAINKVYKTRVKFLKKIIYELNKNNKIIEEKSNELVKDFCSYQLNHFVDWANKKNSDIDFSSYDKTIWL